MDTHTRGDGKETCFLNLPMYIRTPYSVLALAILRWGLGVITILAVWGPSEQPGPDSHSCSRDHRVPRPATSASDLLGPRLSPRGTSGDGRLRGKPTNGRVEHITGASGCETRFERPCDWFCWRPAHRTATLHCVDFEYPAITPVRPRCVWHNIIQG